MDIELKYGDDLYFDALSSIKNALDETRDVDIVIGIPFFNEKDTLPEVVKTALKSLKDSNHKKLIVCSGDPAGKNTLEELKKTCKSPNVTAFLMPHGINGRGYSTRAIFEIAKFYEADVVLLEADLTSQDEKGLNPAWIDRLAEPVLGKYDLAIARFYRHPFEDIMSNLFISPLIEVLYGMRIADPLSGIFAISHDLVEDMCTEFDKLRQQIGGYGLIPWIITTAIKTNNKICEVCFGPKFSPIKLVKKNLIFKEMSRALIECIKRDEEFWLNTPAIVRYPDVFGRQQKIKPLEVVFDYKEFFHSFQKEYFQYRQLFSHILEPETIEELDKMAEEKMQTYDFLPNLWAKVVYSVLLAVAFEPKVEDEDLLEALISIYDGAVSGLLKQLTQLENILIANNKEPDFIISASIKEAFEQHTDCFFQHKKVFVKKWKKLARQTRPIITPLDYIEYIPGVPIVLPKTLEGDKGRKVNTNHIFTRLQKKYENQFKDFLYMLGTNPNEPTSIIAEKINEFMVSLENAIDTLCDGNLFTAEGVERFLANLFECFPHEKVFSVKEQVLKKLLYEFQPSNLMLRQGYKNMRELFSGMDVRDILTLAQYTEDKNYFDRIYLWLEDNIRPDSFEEVELKPIIVNRERFPGIGEFRDISRLNRLTARIAVTNLGKGMGGKFPKLRYFTRITKSLVEAEHFSSLWKSYARERKEVGRKLVNSITGHYGKEMFSAHYIFENWHQRELMTRLSKLANTLERKGMIEESKNINMMVKGHGISMVLQDGTFMPCSAWSWASFSFKGGKGIPTPMFLHVERDWFNHELLENIYEEMGYNPDEIMEQVFQLISQGKESNDIVKVLMGIKPPIEAVVVQELEHYPPAKTLKRYDGNPILMPIKEHWWESKYVLNAAAFRLEDKVYLLYRAFGNDEISRIGLAITDGYRVIERLKNPVFIPETEQEKKGCEDPRVVILNDEIFMFYTAYDGVVAQIAAASISIEDFLNRDFDRWKRKGLAFPNLWDKDAILFPEKINDHYVIYHRIEPSIWMACSKELSFPWPRGDHKIIMGPRAGMMWDSLKIGAGAQPIKTRYGWLLIYHGVDHELVYRLGVILADLKDPSRLLYRSPNPILSPETEWEIGKGKEAWVPNVVFTCGAVPAEDKDILDDDDKILVYYGAADTCIGLATGKVKDLIPKDIRNRLG